MKSSRFKYEYRKSASKLHRIVGDILRSSKLFQNYQVLQEYPVCKINPNHKSGREHFDWVLLDLKCVIEVMGGQHYKVAFGCGQTGLKDIQERDERKKQAAIDAGFVYIAIKFDEIKLVTEDYIWKLYIEKFEETKPLLLNKTPKIKINYNKEKAKAFRKEQYQHKKEWLKKIKSQQEEKND